MGLERFSSRTKGIAIIVLAAFLAACSSGSSQGSSEEPIATDPPPNSTPSPDPDPDPNPPPDPDPDPDPQPAPTITLNSDNPTVGVGGNVALNWNVQNATTCSASGAWGGDKSLIGQEVVGPITSSQTFTLTCSSAGGSAVAMISVAAIGQLQLSWQAPTENVDGTPVDGLTTYRIHYGTNPGQYDDIVEVAASLSTYAIDLAVGSYYVAMTVVDVDDEESGLSNEIERQSS